MTSRLILRMLYRVILITLCLRESLSLFFNKTSNVLVKPFNISRGFQLTFRTCDGGSLFKKNGTNNDYLELVVFPGFMNYTSDNFTPSSLALKWRTASKDNVVRVGKNLDQNRPYDIMFSPGSRNSTLSVSLGTEKYTVVVSNSILGITSSDSMVLGDGFVGCIEFGSNFDISSDNVSVSSGCPLDSQSSCKREKCPTGYKGYYCEINVDDCASLPCHHAATCVDEVANYTCICGPGWYGRNCDNLREMKLCDYKPCKNGGICQHVSDFNNYSCSCPSPFTGRNCTEIIDPCRSSPCVNGGTCNNITSTYFQCVCPQGYGGKTCQTNIDDCATADCGSGKCIDGISNHSCNCTGTGFKGLTCQEDVDECNQSPCRNNGTCTNYAGGYKCTCLKGYSAKNCEIDIDDCASSPCRNGGNCTDLVNDLTCVCAPEYSGRFCEFPLHPCSVNNNCPACDDKPCEHGQCNCTCSLYSMHYNCTCDPGYRGENCSENINECLDNPSLCQMNSTCQDTPGGFECQCQEGYTGKYCNESASICHPNPCANGGTCSNITENSYNCTCATGWTGGNCTEDVDECSKMIDKCNRTNIVACNNTIGSYICVCRDGYQGTYCQDDVNECEPVSPCKNGVCQNLHGTFQCFCANGFQGKKCEENVNDCVLGGNKKCNNGTCIDGVAAFTCKCFEGWKGDRCNQDINECDLGFCKNNATCLNSPGNYECNCKPGFTGRNCSIDIDECNSTSNVNLCQNSGTCIDQVNAFMCNCTNGYEGKYCEVDIDWCNVTRYNGSEPCVYGICRDQVLNYTCDCFPGFYGVNCERDIDECVSHPCRNGATCVQKSNATAVRMYFGPNQSYPESNRSGHLCVCKPGFNGSDCEVDIDECQVYNPCNASGTEMCNDLINDYNCSCKPGFQGRNCSEDVNECEPEPCLNNGTCLNLEARFKCICDSNHTGVRCESELDPCTVQTPCKNGGKCNVTSDLNFTCSCAEGFAGKTCTNRTTIGFNGKSSMTITIPEQISNMSFSFQTIFPDGVLVSQSTKWALALKLGFIEFVWDNNVLFTLGTSFSDSRWHDVSVFVSGDIISAKVGPKTCTERCSNTTPVPKASGAARSSRSSGTQLVVGRGAEVSGRPNFMGSIRDFSVNSETYYPGVAGVSAVDVISDFQRQNVCSPDPCINGKCIDQWFHYTCECDRNWTSTNCSEEVKWGTFGTILRLNNGYNSTGNLSYAKYSFSESFKSLSFSMRTRSESSIVVLLYLNSSVYLSLETANGFLRLRYKDDIIKIINSSQSSKVDDASIHYITINRTTAQIDKAYFDVTVPALSVKEVFVGGVAGLKMFDGISPFRGCIRDVRLNGKQLLFFNQTSAPINLVQENIAMNCSSEDVCGQLSGLSPCSNSGNCTDLWNLHKCTCPWPYGGDNCELYGCQWTNPCPGNATCVNVQARAEFECLTEVTFNGSQSSAVFTNSTGLSSVHSLIAQFRTRQNSSSILVSSHNDTLFEINIRNGRLVVSYNLGVNTTGIISIDIFVSDGKWHEFRMESNASQTTFVILSMELLGLHTRYLGNHSLVRNASILNEAFTTLISTSGVHLGSPSNKTREHLIGCLREVRIGGHLLWFFENLTLNTQPGFSRAESAFLTGDLRNVTTGCQGNPVCTSFLCGTGTCVDLWNDFSCSCPDNYHGQYCENNPCSSSLCVHGDCLIESSGYNCTCFPDYAGKLCNESCANNPCKNGGTCSTSNGKLECSCAAGWTGQFCEDAVPRGSEDDDDLPLIIGISVGGGCLLLLLIIVIICFCTRQTSSTFGTYSPRNEEKLGTHVEMNAVLNVPPPEKLI